MEIMLQDWEKRIMIPLFKKETSMNVKTMNSTMEE